jgi:hypothetical protein
VQVFLLRSQKEAVRKVIFGQFFLFITLIFRIFKCQNQ